MIWNRTFITIAFAVVLAAAALAILGVWFGYIDLTRYILSFMFTSGALCSAIGYFRLIPQGPTVPALLVLLIEKSFIFFLLGAAFFLIGNSQSGSVAPNAALLATYGIFAAAGAAKLFTGIYVFVSVSRDSLDREVLKNPFGEWPKESSR